MKLIGILILYSLQSFANFESCGPQGELEELAKSIAMPNCLNKSIIISNNKVSDCRECGSAFIKRYPEKVSKLSKEDLQKHFLENVTKEFKKTVINNLVETAKLIALPNTGTTFNKATSACKMKSIEDISVGCKSASAIKLLRGSNLFNDLSKEVSNELAKILSPDESFNPKPTLLSRTKPACFIPEKQLLYVSNSALEESLSPQLIQLLSRKEVLNYKTTEDFFNSDELSENYEGDIAELKISIKFHPLLKDIFKSPESISSFFQTVAPPSSNENLRNALYSKQSGEQFDKNLAESCDKSFNAFKEAICSQDFEDGSINLNPVENYSKIFDKSQYDINSDFSSNDLLLETNIKMTQMCYNESSDKKLNLAEKNSLISSTLENKSKDQSLELFCEEKYSSDFKSLNNLMCNTNDSNCIAGTFTCSVFQKLKKIKDPSSLDSKLASTSNKEVNELLRAMLGDTSKIDPKTKEILISQGIIPKADGTIVAQPDIPERRPDFFANQVRSKQTPITQTQPGQTVASPTRRTANTNVPDDSHYNNIGAAPTSTAMPDFSDILRSQGDDLADIQSEIRRRLMGLPNKRPVNADQAKQIARQSFEAIGKTISPEEESALAQRMMGPTETATPQTVFIPHNYQVNDGVNRAQASDSPNLAQKWRENQKQEALMGMAGAQKISPAEILDSTAQTTASKDLTKVTLNLLEDPRVSLSDVFNHKINQNDPETKFLKDLLRSKNNFMLQIKSMNFKVVFDGKNNFNVLLESGDKKEAERIRPQLEMFLKKLKSTSPLHNVMQP